MKELWSAIHEIQKTAENLKTDSTNPHFKSKFSSLESVLDYLRPLWTSHGLVVTQSSGLIQSPLGDREVLKTLVVHSESGQEKEFFFFMRNQKGDLHGEGGSFTYCRRQAVKGIFGLGEEDNDGNSGKEADKRPNPSRGSGLTKPEGKPAISTIQTVSTSSGVASLSSKTPAQGHVQSDKTVDPASPKNWSISEAQAKRLYGMSLKDAKWMPKQLEEILLKFFNVKSTRDLSASDAQVLEKMITSGKSVPEIIHEAER